MGKRIWRMLRVSCALILSVKTAHAEVKFELTPDGPALFYAQSESRVQDLWTVQCYRRLNSCHLHKPGMVMRLDLNGAAWINVATNPGARVTIESGSEVWPALALFAQPISQDILALLDRSETFVVVQEDQLRTRRFRTQGAMLAVSYLEWLAKGPAQTLGNATLWAGSNRSQISGLNPAGVDHIEVSRRRHATNLRRFLPKSKPQSEFSLRAQGAKSYFDAHGRPYSQ